LSISVLNRFLHEKSHRRSHPWPERILWWKRQQKPKAYRFPVTPYLLQRRKTRTIPVLYAPHEVRLLLPHGAYGFETWYQHLDTILPLSSLRTGYHTISGKVKKNVDEPALLYFLPVCALS